MRIILDTNVVLSALLWRGTPYCLLQTIRQREDIKRVSSNLLLEELADVLTRPGAAKRLALFNATAGQILADYAKATHFVTPGAITGSSLTTPTTITSLPPQLPPAPMRLSRGIAIFSAFGLTATSPFSARAIRSRS